MYGYMGKILTIDLSTGSSHIDPLPDEIKLYLGGKAFGARLLYDLIPAGIDALSPENVLIFGTGPFTGSFAPQSVRFSVTTKSPLTGAIANDSCGGDFAMGLKKAGFDFLILKGKASSPVWIEITDEGIEIHDAKNLWGKGTIETQELLPKRQAKAVIGPAGENLVLFSAIVSGHRVAGRSGVGAVMGSKNVKAITAWGKQKVQIADPEKHKALTKWLTKYFKEHPITGDVLPKLGTANLVMVTSARNIMPVNNFSFGSSDEAWKISGQEMASKYLKKNVGCTSCPIQCGRSVEMFKQIMKGPEYETIALMGSNLGIFDMQKLIEIGQKADDLGVDTISCGGTIGWAMEANKKGIWKNGLNFGDADAVLNVMDDIAYRRGIGDELALGSMRLSEKYGGTEFAIHVKGLELPGYDPRGCYGQGLEYATTNRGGCHINGATMFFEATGPLSVAPLSVRGKPELVMLLQNLMMTINSMITCVFSGYATLPSLAAKLEPGGLVYKIVSESFHNAGPVLRAVLKIKAPVAVLWYERFLRHITGEPYTLGDIMEIGERGFNMERLFNVREGFDTKDDTLPDRMLFEPRYKGKDAGVPLDEMLGHYYSIRGWDERGIPKEKTLERLQIRH